MRNVYELLRNDRTWPAGLHLYFQACLSDLDSAIAVAIGTRIPVDRLLDSALVYYDRTCGSALQLFHNFDHFHVSRLSWPLRLPVLLCLQLLVTIAMPKELLIVRSIVSVAHPVLLPISCLFSCFQLGDSLSGLMRMMPLLSSRV